MSVVVPVIPDVRSVAWMIAVPVATEVTMPVPAMPGVLRTVATAGFNEVHVTKVVRSWVAALANIPVAVNWWVNPGVMLGEAGVTVMDESRSTVSDVVPVKVE